MNPAEAEISAAQRASWNKFSPGWRKYDDVMMSFLAPQRDRILHHLQPTGTQVVLDLAGGTGEPGLSIAKRLTGGKVVLTDLAEGMLQVARDKAAAARVGNVEFQLADACALTYANESFDAVSCRLGFMFVPDMQLAANEMARVLKRGGRLATTVWDVPEQNFWVTCMVQGIARHIDVPKPPPGAPGMFRCAQPGLIAGMFTKAGLRDVHEELVPGKLAVGSAERYWTMLTECAAPFAAALGSADAATVSKVRADVVAAMHARFPDGAIDASARLITARK